MFYCKHCKTNSARKTGLRKNKVEFTQRYFCTKCNKYSVNRKGFENYRHSPEVITATFDLRAKGLSLSDVVNHLDQHHKVEVTRKTVLFWQRHTPPRWNISCRLRNTFNLNFRIL